MPQRLDSESLGDTKADYMVTGKTIMVHKLRQSGDLFDHQTTPKVSNQVTNRGSANNKNKVVNKVTVFATVDAIEHL